MTARKPGNVTVALVVCLYLVDAAYLEFEIVVGQHDAFRFPGSA